MKTKKFSELISELRSSSSHEVISVSNHSTQTFIEFSNLLKKFKPILNDLKITTQTPSITKAIESLDKELDRAKRIIRTPDSEQQASLEYITRDLGRSLALVLHAIADAASVEMKERISSLHKETMNTRCFIPSQSASPGDDFEFTDDEDESEEENENDRDEIEVVSLDQEQVVLQLKYGDDDEFKCAVLGLSDLIRGKMVDNEWIKEEGIVMILLSRLGSSEPPNRIMIIRILRSIALDSTENKEMMADVRSLSTLVKSLARGEEERKEAVGLLLALSEIQAIRRRIGRIKGCMIMLVAMLNGDGTIASRDSSRLLNALSSNPQNALHMAEAGYFKPLVQYLNEGSDMSKILMATAVSRMELTDQSRASLGHTGAIEPLVRMFTDGKLEAKLSALSALQNLSTLSDNIHRLIGAGIVVPLLQLLFSVTSVLMTLREPASAILARIAQSETIFVLNQDVAQQILSLLNLSSPVIQYHLLQALNSIAAHPSASRLKNKMLESGAIQLILPFLTEGDIKIRTGALSLLYTLSKDLQEVFVERFDQAHLNIIVNIVSASVSDNEKAAAVGVLSNFPITDKKITCVLKKANLLPILISTMNLITHEPSSRAMICLTNSIARVLIRFTITSDKKLQIYSAEHGVIPLLVKLLSIGSVTAKSTAATSLAQLSQNSLVMARSRKGKWLCMPPSADAYCEVHDGYCFVKNTFCLVKARAISPLIRILDGPNREADEMVLEALSTLLQDDEVLENGSQCIVKFSGVEAIIKTLELGTINVQQQALWMLERIFRVDAHKVKFGESAQVVLIDMAQNGSAQLRPIVAKLLAQLGLLQCQSSYF